MLLRHHIILSISGHSSVPNRLAVCSSNVTLSTQLSLFGGKQVCCFRCSEKLGLNEKETNLLLGKNPTLRSTSLDRIRARVLALQSVGINGFALYRLVIKCPSVLIAEEIDPVISFVRDDLEGKVEAAQLERLFITTEARFLLGFAQKVKLLLHHEVPQEKIAHVLNNANLNKAICCKSVEELERTIAFLKPYHGIEIIVRRPAILNYDLDSQLIPKIRFLEELSGGDANATGTVLRKLPAILSYSLEHMESHVDFMKSYVGLDDREIFKIILVFPNVPFPLKITLLINLDFW
ncbi:hypothetical protein V6Z11_D04G001100 [Gossypium hirsutum]